MNCSRTTSAMATFVAAVFCMDIGALAQTVTLPLVNNGQYTGAGSTNFLVPPNVVAQVIYTYLPTGAGVSMRVALGGAPGSFVYYGPTSTGAIANPPIVVGPATITLSYTNTVSQGPWLAFCTIQTTSSYSFTPSSSVVIPSDGGGPVTVILESSTDLINWTAANPGTYGTTSSNRFFRVRAQR